MKMNKLHLQNQRCTHAPTNKLFSEWLKKGKKTLSQVKPSSSEKILNWKTHYFFKSLYFSENFDLLNPLDSSKFFNCVVIFDELSEKQICGMQEINARGNVYSY